MTDQIISVKQLERTLRQMERFANEAETEARERFQMDNVFDQKHGEWLKGRAAAYRLSIEFIQRDIEIFAVDREDIDYV